MAKKVYLGATRRQRSRAMQIVITVPILDPAWRQDAARRLCDGVSYYIATADALRHS